MNGVAQALIKELSSLEKDLEGVGGTRPRLDAHLAALTEKSSKLAAAIRQVEIDLSAAVLADEKAVAQEDANTQAARVQGRISFYLGSAHETEKIVR